MVAASSSANTLVYTSIERGSSGQSLNNFPGLLVIEHVHDIAVAERMRRHRNRKMHTVFSGPLHHLLQPVAHGFISDGP